jgi:undecaprenyl-diphosphatase
MLSSYDHSLFHLINVVWANSLFDLFFPALTDLHKVRVVAFVLAPLGTAYWLYKGRLPALKVLVALCLTIGATDLVSHRLIKPLVHRPRPDPTQMVVILRAPHGGRYSFPSNHAANCFAGAVFLSSVYPPLRILLYTAAALVAYSRVYVGVHYPIDVLGGALLGLALGSIGAAAFRKWASRQGSPA